MGFCLSVVLACQVAVECQASASITGSFLHRQTKGVKRRSIEVTSNGAQQRIKSPTMPATSHARYHKVNKLQQSRFFQFISKSTYALLKALCVLIRVSTCLFVYLLAHENRSSVDQVDGGFSRPFNLDLRAIPLSVPPSERRSMLCCPWSLCVQAVYHLCVKVVYKAPRHLSSSEAQATGNGCF